MENYENIAFWFGIIGTFVGLISSGIAIYQWAVINESKKRDGELQYILAGINAALCQKQIAWQNQISTLSNSNDPVNMEIIRLHLRARDDLSDITGLTIALEGVIDTENSAISSMYDKSQTMTEKNNKLQAESLKNPLLKANSPVAEAAPKDNQ